MLEREREKKRVGNLNRLFYVLWEKEHLIHQQVFLYFSLYISRMCTRRRRKTFLPSRRRCLLMCRPVSPPGLLLFERLVTINLRGGQTDCRTGPIINRKKAIRSLCRVIDVAHRGVRTATELLYYIIRNEKPFNLATPLRDDDIEWPPVFPIFYSICYYFFLKFYFLK